MQRKYLIQSILTAGTILGVTTLLFLYIAGFRLEKKDDSEIDITKTGIIGAKSIPEGASVYLDEELVTATDDTVAGLTPGKHQLKIHKNGFVTWEKEIEVYEELVTDITAVLVSQTPRLEPLTNTGAKHPAMSPTLSKLAYFSKDGETPGVWVFPLAQNGFSFLRTTPSVVLEDTLATKYSDGVSIVWSPDETQLLVEGAVVDGAATGVSGSFYLVDLTTNTANTVLDEEKILASWEEETVEKRTTFIERLDVPEDIKEQAISPDAIWSPDEKKFLYTTEANSQIEYRVYNMEKPIPVGENVETVVLTLPSYAKQPEISWYADSFHLILTKLEDDQENKGTIKLIRIDGTNETEIYNNTLFSDVVYSAPGGDKIIILTSYKSGDQTDLYTVGIR